MRGWLPLSEAVLSMAVEQLPSPVEAAPERLPRLLALGSLDASTSHLPFAMQQVCFYNTYASVSIIGPPFAIYI